MAVTIFTNALVQVSTSTGVATLYDISSFVRSVAFNRTYDIHDVTTMGATDRARRAGLAEWSFEMGILQSFATSTGGGIDLGGRSLDGLLNDLADHGQNGNTFQVLVRPVNAARDASNPEYSGEAILEEYSPMDGEVGDPLEMDVPMVSAGSLVRDVTTS